MTAAELLEHNRAASSPETAGDGTDEDEDPTVPESSTRKKEGR
ncbi:hypothetical protein NKG05_22585 [Oerskovia sp. M15]